MLEPPSNLPEVSVSATGANGLCERRRTEKIETCYAQRVSRRA